jgi:hypothetical protein
MTTTKNIMSSTLMWKNKIIKYIQNEVDMAEQWSKFYSSFQSKEAATENTYTNK